MRKALVVGINEYALKVKSLNGCINDADKITELLRFNEDKSKNFDVLELVGEKATTENVKDKLEQLFENNDDIALFYFSGHGFDNENDGGIVCYDNLLNYRDIMYYVSKAKAKYKVVILDCCYSGQLGNDIAIGDKTVLGENAIILTACSPTEPAMDNSFIKHGTFTNLLIGALEGGCSDVIGNITAGSIYAYIDQALCSWEQRPYFKANVSSFVSLRNAESKMSVAELKDSLKYFANATDIYKLDPSYEDTNVKNSKEHKPVKPYATDEHISIMKKLQKLNRNGLVVPEGEEFMYFAAMHSKGVKLTALGRHYWRLCKEGKI